MPIYLDHNATSPASAEHLSAVFSRLQGVAANPSSPHAAGRTASVAMANARKQIAASVEVEPGEVIFVSGGSEANNLGTAAVLRGLSKNLSDLHAITTSIEHPCVLEPLKMLSEREGLALTILPVDTHGAISAADLLSAIRPNTALISVMVANNETGVVQPVFPFAEWLNAVRWCKLKPGQSWRSLSSEVFPDWARDLDAAVTQSQLQELHFHVDAVQAWGKIPFTGWRSKGYDSISICGHKLGGLSGIGALILRRGRKFLPLILGGAQERSRRAGTENLAGVLSLGLIAQRIQDSEWWTLVAQMNSRKQRMQEGISALPGVVINSRSESSLPNTVNFSVDGSRRKGEDVLLELDIRGFYASSGSACSSGANRPSHVLMAQHANADLARNAVRISISPDTSDHEIDELLDALREIFQTH
ncbi:MAG: hypothetical protein RI953_1077 [Pseudomonadota bacterium]